LKRSGLVIASLLVLTSLILMIVIYFDLVDVGFIVGSYRFHHWSVILGSFYVAIITPFFAVLKRIKLDSLRSLMRVHVFGNLFAFVFVSIHFAGQLSRPLEFYPDLGSGVGLYVAMGMLVLTGFLLRFGLVSGGSRRLIRVVHVIAVLSFYLVILVHALSGFGII
jgi:hypothetical protein